MNLYRYASHKALILERCIGRTRDASSFGLPCSESIFSSSLALPSHHRELSLALSSAYSSLHRMSVIKSNYSIGDRRCQMKSFGRQEDEKWNFFLYLWLYEQRERKARKTWAIPPVGAYPWKTGGLWILIWFFPQRPAEFKWITSWHPLRGRLMKPLEDWRVNRGMTGSFLCWKFEGNNSRHFLWCKKPSSGRALPGRKQSVFPGRTQNFYKQTLAFGHLRPCSDDEDRWFPGFEGARFF